MPSDKCDSDPFRLDPRLEAWAREQGWTNFRPFQRECADLILGSDRDLIVTAATASGKSEAAVLPLLTQAAARAGGIGALCLCPTKALINDQVRRHSAPAARVGIPVHAWHGDAPQTGKRKLLKERRGLVFMTIESFEGRMIRHPRMVEELFSDLFAIMIDESHEFQEGPRAAQLGCLLARFDDLTRRRTRRIALSATIADPAFARQSLRPQDARSVKIIKGPEDLKTVLSKVRGYDAPPLPGAPAAKAYVRPGAPIAIRDIEMAIFERLRRGTHIVFALSRSNVEDLADGLARQCQRLQVHNPFVPHHGSISKHTREDVEERLRSGEQLTVLSTTTLGLGVDIGTVNSVEIIGAPMSLTSLRQYIGRSGRREAPAAVSLHVTEVPIGSAIKLSDRLRLATARACAALNLLEQRFFEPPKDDGTTLSVVFQEVLAIIKQQRGALFSRLLTLIQSVAAFAIVTEKMLRQILAHMASPDEGFIEQASDGRYLLTEKGEKLVHGPEFYAAFRTTEQWEIVAEDNRKIGSISLSNAMAVGETYCLAGQRWEVTRVELRRYRATVRPSLAGSIPIFDPMVSPEVHERLAQEIRRVLEADDVPTDLDPTAAKHLIEGRSTYLELALGKNVLVANDGLCHLLSWQGTRFNKLLVEVLRAKGFVCSADEVGVAIAEAKPDDVTAALAGELPTMSEISAHVGGVINGKYDRHIPEHLLRQYWATRQLRLEPQLREFCQRIAGMAKDLEPRPTDWALPSPMNHQGNPRNRI